MCGIGRPNSPASEALGPQPKTVDEVAAGSLAGKSARGVATPERAGIGWVGQC